MVRMTKKENLKSLLRFLHRQELCLPAIYEAKYNFTPFFCISQIFCVTKGLGVIPLEIRKGKGLGR